MDLITFGESLVLFAPQSTGPLRYIHSFNRHIAGAESNLAIGLAKLGHQTGFISKVGNDEFGATIRREIQAEGVDVSHLVTDSEHPTGLMFKQIFNGERTEVMYYRSGSAASAFQPEELDWTYLHHASIIHLTGITPMLSTNCAKTVHTIATYAKRQGILLSFDPNIRLKLCTPAQAKEILLPLLKMADIVLLGRDEAEILMGLNDPQEIIAKLRSFGAQKIALKMGRHGAIVADQTQIIDIAPYPTVSVDSVGAGDAFNAGFLSGILRDKPLEECGKMGNAMGSIAVSVQGDIEGIADRRQMEFLVYGTTTIDR